MIEIEKKYRLTKEQFKTVENDLKEFEAEYLGEDFEENNLFGNEELKEKLAAVRLRKIGKLTILTYKQTIPNKMGVKQQIEYETAVEDAEQIEEILKYLGLTKKLVYEKRRKTWKFRNAEVVLDELPFGLFMEIEGSITTIAEAEMFLEAEKFEPETKTYPLLTNELGKRNGEVIEARF